VGDGVTIADICFAAEIALFMNEHARTERLSERGLERILHPAVENDYPLVFAHFAYLVEHEHFKPDLKPYVERLRSKAAA
jgi:elongation factor 1-gamma